MKPQRFKIGQEVTKNSRSLWIDVETQEKAPGPSFGEVVTVLEYVPHFEWWLIRVSKYPGCCYDERDFDPIVANHVLEEELSQLTVGV